MHFILDLSKFKLLLFNMVDCTQLLDWFENTWNGSMRIFMNQIRNSTNDNNDNSSVLFETDFSKNFLIVWTMVKLQIIQELVRIKASSHGLCCI